MPLSCSAARRFSMKVWSQVRWDVHAGKKKKRWDIYAFRSQKVRNNVGFNGGICSESQESLLEALRWLWAESYNLIPEHVLQKKLLSLFIFRKENKTFPQGLTGTTTTFTYDLHTILCEALPSVFRNNTEWKIERFLSLWSIGLQIGGRLRKTNMEGKVLGGDNSRKCFNPNIWIFLKEK